MFSSRNLLPLVAIVGLAFTASPALADAVTLTSADINKTFNLSYNGFSDGTTVSGLTSTSTFTLTEVAGNSYTFSYTVANTTSDPVDSRVSGFAFNTNPTVTGATSTGTFDIAATGGHYPNGIGSVDACFRTAGGSCAGAGGTGLTDGQTGTGTFTLTFASPVTSLTLSDFYVRYQSITGAGNITSATGSGTLTSTGGSTGGQVPEPGMIGLLAAAAGATMLLSRRRRRAVAQPELALA